MKIICRCANDQKLQHYMIWFGISFTQNIFLSFALCQPFYKLKFYISEWVDPSSRSLVSAHCHVYRPVENWNLNIISVSQQNCSSDKDCGRLSWIIISAAGFRSLHIDFLTNRWFPCRQDISPVFTPSLVFVVLLHVISFTDSVWFDRLTFPRLLKQAWTSRRMWTILDVYDLRM